jgi:hypothetical protein
VFDSMSARVSFVVHKVALGDLEVEGNMKINL